MCNFSRDKLQSNVMSNVGAIFRCHNVHFTAGCATHYSDTTMSNCVHIFLLPLFISTDYDFFDFTKIKHLQFR